MTRFSLPALRLPPVRLALLALVPALLAGTAAAQRTSTAAAAASAPVSAHMGEDGAVRYVVRNGDTLYDLARKYMARPDHWRPVQRLNRIADPQRLTPGTTLILPANLLATLPLTARIATFKGTGTIEDGKGTATPLAVDRVVTPGMVIETGRGSFATLQLSNGSRLTLPSQTRLRVMTLRRFRLNDMVDVNFLLEKGRIETKAAPLGESGGRYRIRTPIAVSAVRGTTFRAAYDGAGASSLTEVIEGTVAVSAATDGRAGKATETIGEAFGATVSPQGAVAAEALLPAPALLRPGRVQTDPQLSFALEPLPGAVGYHVQIARDAGFLEMEQEAYSKEPEIRLESVDNGRWFVRVSALAANGLEGMPRTYGMRRVLIGLNASSGKADDGYRFRWASAEAGGTRYYQFRLRPDRPGAPPLVDETGLTDDAITLSDLPPGTYRWSVGVQHYQDGESTVTWLPEQTLTVEAEEGTNGPGAPPGTK